MSWLLITQIPREHPLAKFEQPVWWEWDLELSPHVLKRMVDRRFTEVDLRAMLESAKSVRRDVEPGRWLVESQHEGRPYEVVLEPDRAVRLLVVVTAYPVD